MAGSGEGVLAGRLAGRDEVTILELHGLGALRAQLARNNDFATLGARLHDEAHDTVARAPNCKATEELVPARHALHPSIEAKLLGECRRRNAQPPPSVNVSGL